MLSNSELIQRLANSEIAITGRLIDASNATLFGHLKDDEDFKIIYKPIAGERPLWDFPSGTLAYREYAAYLFSEIFDFNLVPSTVLRDGPYGFGMVQQWIKNAQPDNLIEIAQGSNLYLRKMVLFDTLINNADRKFGHVLLVGDEILMGCDHGVTFHVEDKLRTVLWQFADEPLVTHEIEVLERVANYDFRDFTEYLNDEEIAAIIFRAENILRKGRLPSPSDDRPSIPWPPV